MQKMHHSIWRQAACAFACALASLSICLAGDGRIEISQVMIPLTITNGGSYVVTEPLLSRSTTTNGITVAANDVTIDLNGFSLKGPNTAVGQNGIHQPQEFANLCVRNGMITQWKGSYGLYAGGVNALIRDVQVSRCGIGIRAGEGSVVAGCLSYSNEIGITAGHGSVVTRSKAGTSTYQGFSLGSGVLSDSIAYNNGKYGMSVGNGSVVRRCVASGNGNEGLIASDAVVVDLVACGNASNGVSMYTTCAIFDSVLSSNGYSGVGPYVPALPLTNDALGSLIRDCVATENIWGGVHVRNGSMVKDCLVANNGVGVHVYESYCYVVGNLSASNSYGVWVQSVLSDSAKGNRIQDNTLIDNNTGLLIQGVTNILVQNRASSSAVTNWAIMDGNLSHHWVSNVTNSWPWVNLSY